MGPWPGPSAKMRLHRASIVPHRSVFGTLLGNNSLRTSLGGTRKGIKRSLPPTPEIGFEITLCRLQLQCSCSATHPGLAGPRAPLPGDGPGAPRAKHTKAPLTNTLSPTQPTRAVNYNVQEETTKGYVERERKREGGLLLRLRYCKYRCRSGRERENRLAFRMAAALVRRRPLNTQ